MFCRLALKWMKRKLAANILSILGMVSLIQAASAHPINFNTSSDYVVPLIKWAVRESSTDIWRSHDPNLSTELIGYHEFKTEVHIEGNLDEFKYLVLRFYGPLSAYKLYWDDQLMLENGIVSNTANNEQAGQLLQTIKLPRRITTPGSHTIRLTASNWANGITHPLLKNNFGLKFTYIGYGHILAASESRAILSITLGAGVLVLTALFSLVLFYSGNTYRSYVLLSIFCLLNVAVLLIQYVELYFPVKMGHYTLFSMLLILLIALKGVYLCYFFSHHFNLGWKKISFAILLIASVVSIIYINSDFNFFLMTTIATLFAGYAAFHRRVGSLSSFIGLLGMIAVYVITNQFPLTPGYAYGSIFFAYAMIFSIGKQIKRTNQAKHRLELKSAQLEMAMLKKSIQPHFIMNTLLSIISWLEEQPKIAADLIHALAKEFRIVSDVSSKNEITVKEELELCENHLQIMSLRKGTQYSLVKNNLPLDYKIPPMIFHTLLENGLTHAFQPGEKGTFWLSYSSDDGVHKFTLENNGSHVSLNGNSPEGMGLTFVKSQLRLRYHDEWGLTTGLVDDKWVVEIRLYRS